ncbi:ADP-ribosylation/Crystallin J1 [Mycena epipterygia]|nr:ADP-ribosylation/Crystallin J1 [Mycena epipterygia]
MEATPPMPLALPLPLHRQLVVPAPPSTKIRLALLATALCDALGGPAEFNARFSFAFVAHMAPNDNFRLPKGVWTDDTSMALALGRAIARNGGREVNTNSTSTAEGDAANDGFDEAAQLDAYFRWWHDGTLSATGHCFDIGSTIQRAVSIYRDALKKSDPTSTTTSKLRALLPKGAKDKAEEAERRREAGEKALTRIGRDLKGAVFGGNGSLMRVLPVGLAYWRADAVGAAMGTGKGKDTKGNQYEYGTEKVEAYARRSSAVTHPNAVCAEACAAWSACIARVVRSAAAAHEHQHTPHTPMPTRLTKLDLLHHFATYPWTTPALRTALAAEVPLPARVDVRADPEATEAHYAAHHPIFRLVVQMAAEAGTGAAQDREADGDDDAAAEARTLALLPQAAALPSSGYVVHTLAAALYALLAARTFEGGALLAANMGDDADTVAAVYGGLAGVWYASAEGGAGAGAAMSGQGGEEGGQGKDEDGEGLFWSARVRGWRDALVRRDMVEEVAEELVAFAERQ